MENDNGWTIEFKGGGCLQAKTEAELIKEIVGFYGNPDYGFYVAPIKKIIDADDHTLNRFEHLEFEIKMTQAMIREEAAYYNDEPYERTHPL